jgi:hypothetical protein
LLRKGFIQGIDDLIYPGAWMMNFFRFILTGKTPSAKRSNMAESSPGTNVIKVHIERYDPMASTRTRCPFYWARVSNMMTYEKSLDVRLLFPRSFQFREFLFSIEM